jgi:hypothetical protein
MPVKSKAGTDSTVVGINSTRAIRSAIAESNLPQYELKRPERFSRETSKLKEDYSRVRIRGKDFSNDVKRWRISTTWSIWITGAEPAAAGVEESSTAIIRCSKEASI